MAVPLVAHFEGDGANKRGLCAPYLDKHVTPPRPTRGFGRTYGITMDSPAITRAQARLELAEGLKAYAGQVLKLAPVLAARVECLAAVVSWVWNCGIGAFRASRLRRAINQGRWADAAQFIRKPNTASGVVLRGLTRRRDAEYALFLLGAG